jgi:hypothetical protein
MQKIDGCLTMVSKLPMPPSKNALFIFANTLEIPIVISA